MYQHIAFGVHSYLIVLLILVAITGDYLVQQSKLNLYRALFDNITHAAIGGLSWLVVCLVFKNGCLTQTLSEIALCTLIASCIDLDHFVMARSLHLKDATNLKSRPPLHASLIPLVTTLTVLTVAYVLEYKWTWRLSLIVLTAFASHHTRDATRRGFWFYPFGATPPIPYLAYVALTVAIPYLICLIMYHFNVDRRVNLTSII